MGRLKEASEIIGVNASKHSFSIKSVVLIIASQFILDRREIAGGINEHYVGLYGSFVRNYSKVYKIFWFSAEKNALYEFNENGDLINSARMSMLRAVFKSLTTAKKDSRSKPLFTTVIAYYYAAKDRPLSFLVSLFLLHILRILGLANVMADIIDPPVEVQVTYHESPSLIQIVLGTILDIITLKKGTLMWFCSNSYQEYLTKKYKIPLQRTHVIYDGSVPELITPRPPRKEGL